MIWKQGHHREGEREDHMEKEEVVGEGEGDMMEKTNTEITKRRNPGKMVGFLVVFFPSLLRECYILFLHSNYENAYDHLEGY